MKLSTDKFIYLILLTALMLRLLFMSPYLEDWDSVQFTLAMDHFSIINQLPQPPGYPLYILLGKFLNPFLRNPAFSLTVLSALLGSLMAVPFYLLVEKMTSKTIAILATILLLATPVQWTLSVVALTNIPGMAFAILSAYLLYLGRNSTKYLLWGSFLAGTSLGVRFAEYSILIPLIFVVGYFRGWKNLFHSLSLFVFGILLWLVPMILYTGVSEFIKAHIDQASYIANHDSLFSKDTSLKFRLFRLQKLLTWGYTLFFIPLLLFIILPLIKKTDKIRGFNYIFAIVWLLSYLIPLTFIYNLEVTRYTLPLLPPLVILIALGLYEQKRKIYLSLFALLILLISLESIQQVKLLHTLTPPTIAPTKYVKENFSPQNTTLITTFTYRQFQYYNPEFTNFYGTASVKGDISTDIVIIDLLKSKDNLSVLKNYTWVETKDFLGPEIIFPRISKTTLYVFKKNK